MWYLNYVYSFVFLYGGILILIALSCFHVVKLVKCRHRSSLYRITTFFSSFVISEYQNQFVLSEHTLFSFPRLCYLGSRFVFSSSFNVYHANHMAFSTSGFSFAPCSAGARVTCFLDGLVYSAILEFQVFEGRKYLAAKFPISPVAGSSGTLIYSNSLPVGIYGLHIRDSGYSLVCEVLSSAGIRPSCKVVTVSSINNNIFSKANHIIFKAGTGSGKTNKACSLAESVPGRVLFVCPSVLLASSLYDRCLEGKICSSPMNFGLSVFNRSENVNAKVLIVSAYSFPSYYDSFNLSLFSAFIVDEYDFPLGVHAAVVDYLFTSSFRCLFISATLRTEIDLPAPTQHCNVQEFSNEAIALSRALAHKRVLVIVPTLAHFNKLIKKVPCEHDIYYCHSGNDYETSVFNLAAGNCILVATNPARVGITVPYLDCCLDLGLAVSISWTGSTFIREFVPVFVNELLQAQGRVGRIPVWGALRYFGNFYYIRRKYVAFSSDKIRDPLLYWYTRARLHMPVSFSIPVSVAARRIVECAPSDLEYAILLASHDSQEADRELLSLNVGFSPASTRSVPLKKIKIFCKDTLLNLYDLFSYPYVRSGDLSITSLELSFFVFSLSSFFSSYFVVYGVPLSKLEYTSKPGFVAFFCLLFSICFHLFFRFPYFVFPYVILFSLSFVYLLMFMSIEYFAFAHYMISKIRPGEIITSWYLFSFGLTILIYVSSAFSFIRIVPDVMCRGYRDMAQFIRENKNTLTHYKSPYSTGDVNGNAATVATSVDTISHFGGFSTKTVTIEWQSRSLGSFPYPLTYVIACPLLIFLPLRLQQFCNGTMRIHWGLISCFSVFAIALCVVAMDFLLIPVIACLFSLAYLFDSIFLYFFFAFSYSFLLIIFLEFQPSGHGFSSCFVVQPNNVSSFEYFSSGFVC